jgi:hypothetical protein
MTKRVVALWLGIAICAWAGVCAQTPSVKPPTVVPPAHAAPAGPRTLMTVRLSGTITQYEATTSSLSLSTSTGTVRLAVGASARIRRDGRVIPAADLQKCLGQRAAVRYLDSAGTKTVQSVHVFGKEPSGPAGAISVGRLGETVRANATAVLAAFSRWPDVFERRSSPPVWH